MIKTSEFRAMGCRIFTAIDIPPETKTDLLEQVPDWYEEWEQVFSRFRPDSELARVNRAVGRAVSVSKTFWEVFRAAQWADRSSGELVTPAIYDAVVSAGYSKSFDQMSETDLYPLPENPGIDYKLSEIEVDPDTRTLHLPDGARLDFGGIAKGWAAHQASRRLKNLGPSLVNSGGDIAISGLQNDGSFWSVGVADPQDPQINLEILKLGRCGVATSGTDYRRWKKAGVWQHHIIDPRTGNPAVTDVSTATVIASTVMEAEMHAKVALLLGSEAGLDWLNNHQSVAGMLVSTGNKVLYSQRMENYLWRNNEHSEQQPDNS